MKLEQVVEVYYLHPAMAVPFVIEAKFSHLLRKYIESSDFYIFIHIQERGKKGPKRTTRGNSPLKERDSSK
jgi:hypothetical protein